MTIQAANCREPAILTGAQPVTWFYAPVQSATARLGLPGFSRHAADAAINLHGADALLQAIDDWTMTALTWAWDAGAYADAKRLDNMNASLPVIDLPASLLAISGPLPAALQNGVQFRPLEAELIVSRFILDAAEITMIEPGGAIFIVESLHEMWLTSARPSDGNDGNLPEVPVLLDSQCRARRIAMSTLAPTATTASTSEFEIRAAFDRPLPANQCAPWYTGPLPNLAATASLWQHGARARQRATGELMPWGDGWALSITSIEPEDPEEVTTRNAPSTG